LSIDIEAQSGAPVIVTPLPGSPAALVGLLPGDRLTSTDGAAAQVASRNSTTEGCSSSRPAASARSRSICNGGVRIDGPARAEKAQLQASLHALSG
jgi:S1-C subfamily serine protease